MDTSGYRIPPGQSVAFDAARLLATLAVFVGHATRPAELTDMGLSVIGRSTIPIFLMISGYMTAATMARGGVFYKKVARRYLGLYFVVIPAVFILLLTDLWLVATQSPLIDNIKFQNDYSTLRILREVFEALTFSGEYWRLTTESQGLFGNQSFWTVEYIMAYVVLTAAWYLLTGATRIITILAFALISGPTVILLSPLWLAGVFVYEIHLRCYRSAMLEASGRHAEASRWPRYIRKWAPLYGLLGLVLVITIERTGIGETAYLESKSWASYDWRQYLGMSKRFAWQWALVPGLFLTMLASKYLIYWQPREGLVAWFRSAARHSLPIYIFHFSMIYLVHSMMPDYRNTWTSPDPYLMMVLAAALTLLLSWLCYRYVKPIADRLIARIL